MLAPILDGTVSIVRNDDRRFAGIYGNRRFDDDAAATAAAANAAHYNYYGDDGSGGGYYEGQDSSSAATNEQYYGTNFEEHGPGVGYYSSSDGGVSHLDSDRLEGVSTTGWEYAARGFEDGLTRLFDGAFNR